MRLVTLLSAVFISLTIATSDSPTGPKRIRAPAPVPSSVPTGCQMCCSSRGREFKYCSNNPFDKCEACKFHVCDPPLYCLHWCVNRSPALLCLKIHKKCESESEIVCISKQVETLYVISEMR
ncbi:hypothetical protein Ptr902_04189 [Pyrenophora tritici-repentis]|nr:hypothetical protein Alg130_08559 [Pyrenophora tritici-repentis]KAI0607258.1 hypothetical protein TUN205_08503 [Pyrenophora tritici-repentis]KAI0619416.1 hypothetical protein TUN199_08584 [Pyrenophora tritici-repentis]KAI2485249.1 hypothetical protein Ptr902_04189 [Pyrenophora tritici-repentis]